MSGSQIKGGGRAIMSQGSQDALVDLLMSLSVSSEKEGKPQSEHDQKRKKKQFIRNLVQEHERKQCRRKYGSGTTTNDSGKESGSNNTSSRSTNPTSAASATGGTTKSTSSGSNEKVRIELVEAIIKDEKKDNKKDKKDKKAKKAKKSSSDPNKFKEGTKKVMVLPRSTTSKDLLKLASSKLKIKKPLRVFLKVSKTTHYNLEGQDDLSGVDDGTALYVTTTADAPPAEANTENETTEGLVTGDTSPDIDPLDMVKRAYERQEHNRRQNRRSYSKHDKQNATTSTMIIDQEQKAKYAKVRADLPAASFKGKIVDSVRENRVVVLCGATGCGKSTQVPQFLLENEEAQDANEENPGPKKYIIVTQPRKVAAIALANRVAEERGSPTPGEAGSSVGYMVRSDRRVDERSCRIIYMTVGILLRMLVSHSQSESATEDNQRSSFSIQNISHLVIDEVHERDVNTDFTLTLLKGFLLSQSSPTLSHLRLILMSATASSDLFVKYFTPNRIPSPKPPVVLEIPGRTFPVDIKWLPDCQTFAGSTMWRPSNNNLQQNETDTTNSGTALSPRARDKIDDKFIRSLIVQIVKQQESKGELKRRTGNRTTGAILVFLPGRGEIESLAGCLYDKSTIVGNREVCNILKLHSAIPKSEQQKVFKAAVEGTVKIVLATNIAETSVTISDVTHVIDTCRVKESRYNASTRIRELVTVWTSKASLKQRAGRAGRTSAGVCWRLCSEDFCQQQLPSQTAPEMLRTPLDELVLQICLLYEQRRDDFYKSNKDGVFAAGAQPVKFLSLTPAPPPQNSLVQACNHLLEVDALRVVDTDGSEETDYWSYRLTPLGYHLSRLPMDAKVGKVLIVGCILGCLDGALTVAAALSCTKSCFLSAFGNPANHPPAFSARESLIENGFGGKNWQGGTVKGDLIAVIAAYRAWKKHKSDGQKWKFCSNHAMDHTVLKEMDRLRHQFRDLLVDAGFVPRESNEFDSCNHASEDALLTSCCLVAGLYPNICSLIRPRKGGPKGGRLYTNDGDECRPQSNSFQRKRLQQASETGKDAYAVYHAKHRSIGTSQQTHRPPEVFLTEVNFVSRFALLLFGGDLEIVKNAIIVDKWLKFKVRGDGDKSSVNNAVLLLALRETLDEMILEHVLESSSSASANMEETLKSIGSLQRHQEVIKVVRKLLSEEG